MKYNIVVDIGNTLCKSAVYSDNTLVKNISGEFELKEILALIDEFPNAKKIFSTVRNLELEEKIFFEENNFINIRSLKKLPINILYESPETLGEDRLAAVCGAAFLAKSVFPLMVIQLGTCITYDYVDELGNYAGGAISPGIYMRFKALHNFTSKLPLLTPEKNFEYLGKNTKMSINSGVMLGTFAELRFRIDEFKEKHTNAKIFISGGDIKYFDFSDENRIFAVPNIVLTGLNYLLNSNT